MGKERKIIECVKESWINGFPHAKKENAYQLDIINVALLTPYPGTDLYR